jgi:hypothetical protein
MTAVKKPRRGLEARIRPGESIRLREGVEIHNTGATIANITVKTLDREGRPNGIERK